MGLCPGSYLYTCSNFERNLIKSKRRTDSLQILVVAIKGDCGRYCIGIILVRKNCYDDVISGVFRKYSHLKAAEQNQLI